MAFNPFNVFRRNQKILFALLTVMVMFMFVLSFGQGDFFSSVPKWLGSTRHSGELIAVVDGTKVYESDLSRLNTRRQLANQYMAAAATRAAENLRKSVADGLSRVTPENRQFFQAFLAARQSGYIDPQTLQRLQMMQMFGQQVGPEHIQAAQQQTIAALRGALAEILSAKSPKENDLTIARDAQALMDLEQSGHTRTHYFSSLPNRGNRDLLEFDLWLHKADKLGIKFTPEDVNTLANEEFLRRVTNEDWKDVENAMRNKRGFAPDTLREALADEFRARAAQEAVLGAAYVRPTGQYYDDPYDSFTFYREQTSPGRFGFVSVPAENFIPEVKGEPSETELRELFNKGKTIEPDPRLSRIGLREPRKVKLEWVEVKGDEPYYKTAADDGVRKAESMAKVGGFFVAPFGGSAAALLAAPAGLTVPDPVLASKYQQYKTEQVRAAQDNWFSRPPFGFGGVSKPLDVSVVSARNVGAMAAALAIPGNPLDAVGLLAGLSYAADQKARTESLAAALIGPVGPGIPAAAVATVAVQSKATQPLPLDAVRGQLTERAKEDFARTIATSDLTKLNEEMTKLADELKKAAGDDAKVKAKEAEIRTYVDKFVKEKGVKTGRSAEFRDQFTIAEDPGLTPLKERLLSLGGRTMGRYVDPLSFGVQFFYESDPLNPRAAQPSTGLYKPQEYPHRVVIGPTATESEFMVWRVAEEDASSPRDFNAPGAREKTLAAWRKLKARELAKQAAEQLAKECQNLGTNFFEIEQKLRDKRAAFAGRFPSPPAQERVKYFEIAGVSPIVTQPGFMPAQEQVNAYTLGKSENIPYPTPKMEDELLAAKEKPLSTAVVLADNPEDTYYVAVLLRRDEKSADEFGQDVYHPNTAFQARPMLQGAVMQRRQAELHKKAHDTAVALLKAEFKVDKENDAKLKEKSETSDNE